MRLTLRQLMSDKKTMEQYVCERIPSNGTRVVLAAGGEGESWADLYPVWIDGTGWELHLERSDEHVDLQDVYDQFRRQEMTYEEWWRDFEWQTYRSTMLKQGIERPDAECRYLTAQDIVEYFQGKISLRLAYQIMDECQPVRAGKKRLVTAESFRDYLRAARKESPPQVAESRPARPAATSRKRGWSPADGGFEFFRFPH